MDLDSGGGIVVLEFGFGSGSGVFSSSGSGWIGSGPTTKKLKILNRFILR